MDGQSGCCCWSAGTGPGETAAGYEQIGKHDEELGEVNDRSSRNRIVLKRKNSFRRAGRTGGSACAATTAGRGDWATPSPASSRSNNFRQFSQAIGTNTVDCSLSCSSCEEGEEEEEEEVGCVSGLENSRVFGGMSRRQ